MIGHNSESFKRDWYRHVWSHPERDPALIAMCMLIHRYLAANGETVALSNQQIARELNCSPTTAKKLKRKVLDLSICRLVSPGCPIKQTKSIIAPCIARSESDLGQILPQSESDLGGGSNFDPGLGQNAAPYKESKQKKKETGSETVVPTGGKRNRHKYSDDFENFWKRYVAMSRVLGAAEGDKLPAFKEWKKLHTDDKVIAYYCLCDYQAYHQRENQNTGKCTMRHAERYLRHHSWEKLNPFWMSADDETLRAVYEACPPNGHWPENWGPPVGHKLSAWNGHIENFGLHRFDIRRHQ